MIFALFLNLHSTFYFNVCLCYMFQITPDHAKLVVEGTVVLHNIMRTRYPNIQNAELEAPAGNQARGEQLVSSRTWRQRLAVLREPPERGSSSVPTSGITSCLKREVCPGKSKRLQQPMLETTTHSGSAMD